MMRRFCIFCFVCMGAVFSINAQDMLVLRDGSIIEAKVTEISPSEIRYKRFDHLDGPTIVVPAASVLSIKYENGVVEIINASPLGAGAVPGLAPGEPISDVPAALQTILNSLPAIPIAGNNLKFIFNGDKWTATVNGENFLAGAIELESTPDGAVLTLKQTHIWPGAVGRTAGRIASRVPGGGAAAGALNTAGSIAGAVGAVEASGPEIVLEYKAGPPSSLRLISSTNTGQENTPAASGTTALNPDKFIFAVNVNAGGAIGYAWEDSGNGLGINFELGKGKFNSEINLIISYESFGLITTFNYFSPRSNGGLYVGGGIGYIFGYDFFMVGLNLGYKFVATSGVYARVGFFGGINLIGFEYNPLYFKPDLAIGWTMR